MKTIMAAALAIAVLVACGAQQPGSRAKESAVNEGAPQPGQARDAEESLAPAGPSAPNLAGALEIRLRVKTGTMTIVVPDVKAAEGALAKAADKYAGYVAQSRIEASTGSVTLKIPADRFDALVAEVEKLGELKEKQIAAEDVTDQYYDLENRVKNKRILLSRYQDYLRRAADTKELLALEAAINSVTTDIESLEGSFRTLKNSISYSTLSMTIELPPEQQKDDSLPSLAVGLSDVGNFLVTFLYYLVLVVIYTIIVVVPLTLLGGAVYYLGFGRVGLVLKFFRALGRKKKSATPPPPA